MLMVLALGRLIAVGLLPHGGGAVLLGFWSVLFACWLFGCLRLSPMMAWLAGCLVWLSLGLVLVFGLSDFSLYFAGFSFLFLLGFML